MRRPLGGWIVKGLDEPIQSITREISTVKPIHPMLFL